VAEQVRGRKKRSAKEAHADPPIVLSALAPLREVEASRPGFVARIVEVYLDDAPRRIEGLRSASATGDRVRAHREAHTLKSSSATFGALVLSNMCRDLQEATASDGPAVPAHLVERIASEFDRVAGALSQMLAEDRDVHDPR
jgi:HPt (histidine-containing phosphotransfer) domain-containing protein